MTNIPFFSVVIPLYNRADVVTDGIERFAYDLALFLAGHDGDLVTKRARIA